MFELDATFGLSTKGKQVLLCRNFKYLKEGDNVDGSTAWRCRYYQSLKCKTRLLTNVIQIVDDRQLDHTDDGNMLHSLARKPVGD